MFRRPLALLLLPFVAALFVGGAAAFAEEPPAAAEEAKPQVASAEDAARALDLFKDEYRARGLKGDDKLAQRDWAMSELAKFQHPDVVDALAKIARGSDDTLRVLAVIYLGEQTALPGVAGPEILRVLRRNSKDPILVLSALQSLGNLKYLGAEKEISDLLGYEDFAVKKAAIQAIGEIGEMRLWKEVVRLAGVSVKTGDDASVGTETGGKEEVVEEGYSYEGVEVTYDTGTSGDGDQQMAEKIGKEKLAANKAAAMAKAGKGGAGGGSGAGATSSGGRGGVSRDPKELLPFVLNTLWKLTGEKFTNSKQVAEWVVKNRDVIKERVKALDEAEKVQVEEAKALK